MSANVPVARELAQHPQGRAQPLTDGRRLDVAEDRSHHAFVARSLCGCRRVGTDAKWAVVHLGDVGRHQLPLGDRPGRSATHGLMGQSLRVRAVEIWAVEGQSRRVGYRLAARLTFY